MNHLHDTPEAPKKLQDLLRAPLDVKLQLLEHYTELARMLVREIIDEEVDQLAGARYQRHKPHEGRYYRWGRNPGSVKLGSERLPLEVPRVRDQVEDKERPLESYQALHEGVAVEDHLDEAILLGLSQRDYERVARGFVDGFGLSQSSVSRAFVARSTQALERFEQRSLAEDDFVALWLDGKTLASEQIVLCLGLRLDGVKRVLGFVECSTENAEAVKGLFRELIERGLRFDEGLLVVVDGGKGLAKATRETFGSFAVLQRCQWHKRENVVGYLNKDDQVAYRSRLQAAYQKTNYREARAALMEIHRELEALNRSAARSLMEGLDETLTLHRLGLFNQLGTHLKTTNAIENLNSRLEAYLGKVKHWMTSDQRQRWVALAALEIEPRFKRIDHAQRLPLLRQALRREVGLETEPLSQTNSN